MTKPAQVSKTNSGKPDPDIVSLIPALRAFARTFCRDSTNADDLVQETLTKGIAAIDRFEPGTNMKSWLFTIMRNTFYTRIKAYTREAPGLLDCVSGMPITPAPPARGGHAAAGGGGGGRPGAGERTPDPPTPPPRRARRGRGGGGGAHQI